MYACFDFSVLFYGKQVKAIIGSNKQSILDPSKMFGEVEICINAEVRWGYVLNTETVGDCTYIHLWDTCVGN